MKPSFESPSCLPPLRGLGIGIREEAGLVGLVGETSSVRGVESREVQGGSVLQVQGQDLG